MGQCRWIFDPYFLAQKAILSPMLLHVTAQTFMKKLIRENLMKILCRFLHNIFLYNTIEALLCRVSYYFPT